MLLFSPSGNSSSCVYVMGDFNVDMMTDSKSLFVAHRQQFCNTASCKLVNVEILYELATSDHMLLYIAALLNVEHVPLLCGNNNAASSSKLDWSRLSREVVAGYSLRTVF